MLIHTTTETLVHEAFRTPLQSFRSRTLRQLDEDRDALAERLRSTWELETKRVSAEDFSEEKVPFEAVLDVLRDVVRDTRVVVDNYRSSDRLNYEAGNVTAIAVGGNTLSRGLTLEGLVSSLFVRAVSAYDTLLQMGRWFGYRDRYGDLPRIWMTDELADWFKHLATVEAEMRQDINRYMTTNETPLTFAVRLQSHPKLSITSKAKMASAVLAHAAYGGQLVESRYFDVSGTGGGWLARNAAATRALLVEAAKDGVRTDIGREQAALFTDVPYAYVVDFLRNYEFHRDSPDGDRDRLVGYIEKRVRIGALQRWSVAVIGNGRDETESRDLGGGVSVRMVKRARLGQRDEPAGDVADIKTLSSRRDETIDLQLDGPVPKEHQEILRLRQKQRPDQGLLLLYPIEPTSDTGQKLGRRPLGAPTEDVVVGAAFVFPEPRVGTIDSEVEYWSADLSSVSVEEEDLSVLEQDDDA